MNKSHLLGRLQSPIDLTALLDVIFIVLLVVICHQQNLSTQAQARQSDAVTAAEQALNEANAAKELYEERLDTVTHIQEYVSILTVDIDYQPGNAKERHIRLLKDGVADEIETLTLTPQTEAETFLSLSETLKEILEEAEGKPVILSLDLDQILYRDEEAMGNLIASLLEEYDNLYFK
ncbi:MAG: hypothetical protein K5696_11975 [Lachnospiraceae bacterium]|nr:hypothetical protein [Lachnospiraceae bacterium]